MLPPFLEFWPLALIQHFANVALVTPASTGAACSSPVNLFLFSLVVVVPIGAAYSY